MINNDLKMEIVREFYRLIDENQSDKIAEIIADNFIDYDAKEKGKGLLELQGLIKALHNGFSNIKHSLELVHYVDEEKIFVRWKMTAKHTGSFFDIPASEKNIEFYGHDLFRIEKKLLSSGILNNYYL